MQPCTVQTKSELFPAPYLHGCAALCHLCDTGRHDQGIALVWRSFPDIDDFTVRTLEVIVQQVQMLSTSNKQAALDVNADDTRRVENLLHTVTRFKGAQNAPDLVTQLVRWSDGHVRG